MKKNRLLKRISAMIASAALIAGLVVTSASASGLPDATQKGSITVHKLATMGESTTNHDGTQLSEAETTLLGSPLKGATFALYKVVDDSIIDDTSDPDELVALNDENLIELVSEQVTPDNGIIFWENLEIGYYVLVETDAPSGYAKSASAIITLPFGFNPDPSNDDATTAYNYDVHVYPKNVNDNDLIKVVTSTQDAYVVGEAVTWEIKAKIDIANGLYDDTPLYGELSLTDPLDERLTYTAGTANVSLTGGSNPESLIPDTHYTEVISLDNDNNAQTVVWELTQAGLELAQERGSTGITVEISTIINDRAQGGLTGSITNTAEAYIKYLSGDETDIEIDPDEKPEILLGGVIIDKTNRDETEKLANAKFKIAASKSNAQNNIFIKDLAGEDIEVTTDDNGYAHFVDFSGVSPAVNWEIENTFYLVETQAPAGYIKKQSAVEVVMSANGDAVNLKVVTVLNQKPTDPAIPGEEKPTFQLPVTGGIGTVLIIVIGLTLIVGALLVIIKNRRKHA
ncbi:MAG: SpaH/EbpB family LPXTG-anchored major pilin [Suipraeoptans sp.]